MSRSRSFAFSLPLAIGLALCIGGIPSASASPFTGIYSFGDSLSDAGDAYIASGSQVPVSPPYSQGRFTNGNLWVQDLAAAFGLGPVTPSLAGGNDFAVGGAETGTTLVHTANASDLPSQLLAFNQAVAAGAVTPQAGDLYTLWIGSNELDALMTSVLNGSMTPTATNFQTDIGQAIANVDSFVGGLANDGMKHLLALNVPDLSKTPGAIAAASQTPNPNVTLGELQTLTQEFNAQLSTSLMSLAQSEGFALTQVNIYGAMDQVVADPAAYGLSDVTDPCWTGNFTDPTSGQTCGDPSQYFFWDGLHPTAAAHRLVATTAEAMLVPAPDTLSVFAIGLLWLAVMRRRPRNRTAPARRL